MHLSPTFLVAVGEHLTTGTLGKRVCLAPLEETVHPGGGRALGTGWHKCESACSHSVDQKERGAQFPPLRFYSIQDSKPWESTALSSSPPLTERHSQTPLNVCFTETRGPNPAKLIIKSNTQHLRDSQHSWAEGFSQSQVHLHRLRGGLT